LLDKSILAKLNTEAFMNTLQELHEIPNNMAIVGSEMDDYEKQKINIQKMLNTAMVNLEGAEATAISFPDPSRTLSNEGQRKAYVIEKTGPERRVIVELKNQQLSIESNSLDTWRMYKRLTNQFDAAKHKAELMAAVLRYLDNGQE
jgi:hypothetical protein